MDTQMFDEIDAGVCQITPPVPHIEPTVIVIFGASGDLTHRKIVPALYNLTRNGSLPPSCSIVGFARRPWSDEQFREGLLDSTKKYSHLQPVDVNVWNDFAKKIFYHQGEFSDEQAYIRLARRLYEQFPQTHNFLFYLATDPEQFALISGFLAKAGLSQEDMRARGFRRLIVEKPFGQHGPSASYLNKALRQCFAENDIFRIDHYLGKDTVQNLLYFRFANSIFEPLWNHRYIDHVQITVAEKVGVEGRGGYYDKAGAARDMLQNHLLQLLCLVAMEPPAALDAEAIRDEKVKVLRSVPAYTPVALRARSVRGQYGPGTDADGQPLRSYLEEERIAAASQTETFVAVQLEVDNWRWAGVPFFLRTGKSLSEQVSEINIVFKRPPGVLFAGFCGERLKSNRLCIRIQPNESISLQFNAKAPGSATVQQVNMDFQYRNGAWDYFPEAYERLLMDALVGDTTLFTRWDEVEQAWRIVDVMRAGWNLETQTPLPIYAAGGNGPREADELLQRSGRSWVPIWASKAGRKS